MPSSDEFDSSQRQNVAERRQFIKRWAEYVRTHEDSEWSRQQNELIDSQLQSANELARRGETDPVEFISALQRRRTNHEQH